MARFVRTPFGHTNMTPIHINEPKEGEYLSLKKNEEDWPVVICDEEMIQTFFARSSRPGSARQVDGTWGKDYKAGGFALDDRRFPALYLGTLQLVWASLTELEPIDLDMGRAIRNSTTNPLLAKAWKEYIGQYNKENTIVEWKELEHWKARLHAQRMDHMTPGGMKKEKLHTRKVPEGRKRKGTPNIKYPPGYRNEEVDDEESDNLFLPKGDAAAPEIKHEPNDSISWEEMEALYADPDPPYPTSSQSSKRSKLDLSGRFSIRPSTPLNGRLGTPTPSSIRHGTPFKAVNKKIDVNDPNTVVIYVDNPHKKFKVRRSGLDASPLLSKLLTHHPENGWYIMSPMLSALDADAFRPVGEYIDRREYHPNILDDGTAHVRLEGDLTPAMLHHQVLRCGTVYHVAHTLAMPGLQDLAFRKLRALEPHYQPLEILTVVELLFDIATREMRHYLTQHVADNYWSIVLAETKKMADVMVANAALARAVFGKMSGKGDDEMKEDEDKDEDVKREEGKEGPKEEGLLSPKPKKEQVDSTNDGAKGHDAKREAGIVQENKDDAGTQPNKEEKTDEAVTQTEEEMVRMALRRSDEEQTEEDWVQLVQRQSDLFEAF